MDLKGLKEQKNGIKVKLFWIKNRMLVRMEEVLEIHGIKIPKGFITDGATIPKIFWNILSPYGNYFYAVLLHDYLCLYAKLQVKKKDCIKIRILAGKFLREELRNQGVPFIKRLLIGSAVRLDTLIMYQILKKWSLESYYKEMLKNNPQILESFKELKFENSNT